MYTLYLHCGIYKTGSSFLQTMFTRNRELLNNNGIHYPKSFKELEMLEGKISPGNGIHLSDSLCKDEKDIINLMSEDLNEAKKMDMHGVLYSSERLFHRFAENSTFEKLYSSTKAVGYDEIQALIYFRDPVSHALSIYKHRAKYGDHKDFSEWLKTELEVFKLIRAFLEYSKDLDTKWTCRKYRPESAYMINSAFTDWLNISAPKVPDDDRVNKSLQLNEIRVLQALKEKYPGSGPYLRNAFLSLDSSDKESEKMIKEESSRLVAEKWRDNQTLLKSLNTYMKEDEKLKLETNQKPGESHPFTVLSEKQIHAFAEGVNNYIESQKLYFRVTDLWIRGVNKVRRKWAASKISSNF